MFAALGGKTNDKNTDVKLIAALSLYSKNSLAALFSNDIPLIDCAVVYSRMNKRDIEIMSDFVGRVSGKKYFETVKKRLKNRRFGRALDSLLRGCN